MQERILITGGTGFIGSALVSDWLAAGHDVTVLTRRPEQTRQRWPAVTAVAGMDELQGPYDVLVNLAGEGIADQRWSAARKKALYDSRVRLTQALVNWAQSTHQHFRVVLSASAVGVYGATAHLHSPPLTESAPAGADFAARLCHDWEEAAASFQAVTDRLLILRTGIVLARDGGMLKRLWLPFSLGLGGVIGSGNQVLSWIHLHDYLRAVHYLLDSTVTGVVNMTAPNPVTNRTFTRALASVLHRPALLPLPTALAKLLFGEMSELLLQGQWVVPAVLEEQNFVFDFTDICQVLLHEAGRT